MKMVKLPLLYTLLPLFNNSIPHIYLVIVKIMYIDNIKNFNNSRHFIPVKNAEFLLNKQPAIKPKRR